MDWIAGFYERQMRWADLGNLPVGEFERGRVADLEADHARHGRIGRVDAAGGSESDPGDGLEGATGADRDDGDVQRRRRLKVLELGAGDGQTAAATADRGHEVTAVELVASRAARARELAAEGERSACGGSLRVLEGDFYELDVGSGFDVVAYWDGFGVGEDDDQRRLLRRIAAWLVPDGIALIEVYTPWYWAAMAGTQNAFGEARRKYGFDADGVRMRDTWWPEGRDDEAVTQTLRCYGPADLRLLLEGTGLQLVDRTPGGALDSDGKWQRRVPLAEAHNFRAVLKRAVATGR